MKIGKLRKEKNISSAYMELSRNDEIAADLLAQKGMFRQACYFLIQAMEKSIRAKIFTKINPNYDYNRKINQHHSLKESIELLIEIILPTNKMMREHIKSQIEELILNNIKYKYLHNNLRYPIYMNNSYFMLEVGKKNFEILKERLKKLRIYLIELDKII